MKILGKRAGSAQFSTAAAKRRLFILLSIFATALLIPLGFLANKVYSQFEEEMYFEYKWNAEKLVRHANKRLYKIISKEDERSFGDYQYFKWIVDPLTKEKKKTTSRLAYPHKMKHIPGFIGHFQIDAEDKFSSPLLPYIEKKYLTKKVKMEWDEIASRMEKQELIKTLLVENGFLKLPKVKDPKAWEKERQIAQTDSEKSPKDVKRVLKDEDLKEHKSRKEEEFISKNTKEDKWDPNVGTTSQSDYTAFTVEIDPFLWKRSKDGHFFFYRKVWRKNMRYIQGFVVDGHEFLEDIVVPLLKERKFENEVALQVLHDYDSIKEFIFTPGTPGHPDIQIKSENLVQHEDIKILYGALYKPLERIGFMFTTKSLPPGSGATTVSMLLIAVSLVVVIGIFILYRAGNKQIMLAEERLNFVSAVSHELKTPLTSILMYSEMLKEGMVSDVERRNAYYDFIFFESERLSRLISNVLQLSRLGKESQAVDIEACSVNRLCDLIRSKTHTLLTKNEFKLKMACDGLKVDDFDVLVDQDAFAQIVINLMDNAIKFSIDKDAPDKTIRQLDIGFRMSGKPGHVVFYVRDYGPGVETSQGKKIFDLFYRVGDEMTRTKPGTGIGLALVSELAIAMNGSVEYANKKPGAEFTVTLPIKSH